MRALCAVRWNARRNRPPAHGVLRTAHAVPRPSIPFWHHTFRTMTVSLAVPAVLVARAKAGDQAALEALFRAFETPVYNLARRIMRTPEDAEDVLQETFLEVVRSIGQYRGEGHLWGWIRRIAATKALMRIRRDHLR